MERTPGHAPRGAGAGDCCGVVTAVVGGRVAGAVVVTGGSRVVGGGVAGMVVTIGTVVTGTVTGGTGTVVGTTAPPMLKPRMFESDAIMSKFAGSCHFACTVKDPDPRF